MHYDIKIWKLKCIFNMAYCIVIDSFFISKISIHSFLRHAELSLTYSNLLIQLNLIFIFEEISYAIVVDSFPKWFSCSLIFQAFEIPQYGLICGYEKYPIVLFSIHLLSTIPLQHAISQSTMHYDIERLHYITLHYYWFIFEFQIECNFIVWKNSFS